MSSFSMNKRKIRNLEKRITNIEKSKGQSRQWKNAYETLKEILLENESRQGINLSFTGGLKEIRLVKKIADFAYSKSANIY